MLVHASAGDNCAGFGAGLQRLERGLCRQGARRVVARARFLKSSPAFTRFVIATFRAYRRRQSGALAPSEICQVSRPTRRRHAQSADQS
jgi:hypothetical protein